MKFLKSHLLEKVPMKIDTSKLESELTRLGLEVDSMEKLKNKSDVLFDLDLTPNRGDCFSVLGIARELAAASNKKIKKENNTLKASKLSPKSRVKISAKAACPRYSFIEIYNLDNTKKLPDFIKNHFLIKSEVNVKNKKLIDVACGTGDIAELFLKHVSKLSEVTCVDPNEGMISKGKNKLSKFKNINWINAPAEKIPLYDSLFDFYTISFGLRNTAKIHKAIAEAYRVLKPGGRFLCLEFSKIQNTNSVSYTHLTVPTKRIV